MHQGPIVQSVGNRVRFPCPRCQHHRFMTIGSGRSFSLALSRQEVGCETFIHSDPADWAHTRLAHLHVASLGASHPNAHSRRADHLVTIELGGPSPQSLRSYVRMKQTERILHLRVAMADPHSSITMLEVNKGLGSSGKSSLIALYA